MDEQCITIKELAKQCNIDNLTTDEESYLDTLLEVSTLTVENKIQQKLSDLATANGDVLPAPLRQAVLLIAANLYANREPVAYGVPQRVPYTLDYLIGPYIKYI